MKNHISRLIELKSKLKDTENLLNSGDFIAEALASLPETEVRKAVSRYIEARQSLLFVQEQCTDEIQAIKVPLKESMVAQDTKSIKEQGVSVSLRPRTTYKGSDAELALRDKDLLDAALAAGALAYPPTINTKHLTKEMKDAIERAAKVTHSITIK